MDRLENIKSQLTQNQTSDEVDIFAHLSMAPLDPVFGISQAYKADPSPLKIDLGVGAYRTDEEKPYVFETVKRVEQEIVNDKSLNKEYLPIDGLPQFNKLAQELMFGKENPLIAQGRIVTAQCIGGTGALRVGFEFLQTHLPAEVYTSKPTWGNHNSVIQRAGLRQLEYPYYDPKTRGFDFNGMVSTLSKARYGSIVLLHVCAHNPTGVDPTEEQWLKIAEVCKRRKLVPFFDCAYQGFASGDLYRDTFSIRKFCELGFQMVVSQSFSKNMGLYGERVGAVHFVTSSKEVSARLLSQLKFIIRTMHSNSNSHGARIAARLLGDQRNFQAWQNELSTVTGRIIKMRELLKAELVKINCPGNWDHITNQKGFFTYTGLTPQQCEILTQKYHVFLLKNGRMSMAGVTTKNVSHLANSMKAAILESK